MLNRQRLHNDKDFQHLKFVKQQNSRWYIEIPNYTGPQEDLEMVCGADSLLDILAQEENSVHISVFTYPISNPKFILCFSEEESDGAWYHVVGMQSHLKIWLCKVIKYLYPGFPLILYCKTP